MVILKNQLIYLRKIVPPPLVFLMMGYMWFVWFRFQHLYLNLLPKDEKNMKITLKWPKNQVTVK
jgi:hypothetical protein